MEKLGCRPDIECWEIQGNLERRHLKGAPTASHRQRKIRGETEWARLGHVNHAARIPLTRIDDRLKFYRNRFRVLSCELVRLVRNRVHRPPRRRASLNICAPPKDRSCP